MAQLDELELGKTLGRVEQKVDSVISSLSAFKKDVDAEIAAHDTHIQSLLTAQSEKKGADHVMLAVYSFLMIGFWKIIEHIPSMLK